MRIGSLSESLASALLRQEQAGTGISTRRIKYSKTTGQRPGLTASDTRVAERERERERRAHFQTDRQTDRTDRDWNARVSE